MLGKIIGAIAGDRLAKRYVGPRSGVSGALIGAGLATVTRRMGPVGMVAAAVGGYAASKLLEKRRARRGY